MNNEKTLLALGGELAAYGKQQITNLAEQLAVAIADEPVQGYIKAKQIIETCEQAIKNPIVVKAVRDEAEKYAKEGGLRLFGHKIEPIEAGVKYDYSECNDPVLKRLLDKKEQLDKEIKDRQKFLQAVPYKGMSINDEETGEIDITVYPPVKSSTSTIKLTLSK